MCTDATTKIELPITPNSHIMELLIKAQHFFEHATMHIVDSSLNIRQL